MKRIIAATAVAVVALIAAQAQAQMAVPVADRGFMLEAASGGMAEVELGRLASQRAATDAVRQFGQRMVNDHGLANQELMQIAQRKGVALPQQPDAKHRAAMDRLASMSGPQFDQEYMIEMVKDHQNDAVVFERETREGRDPELRAFAAKTLPVIRDHLRLATDLHSRVAQATVPVVPAPPAAAVVPAPAPAVTAVVPAPPAASPPTTVVVTTTVVPQPPFCGGAYRPDAGTNFAGCP